MNGLEYVLAGQKGANLGLKSGLPKMSKYNFGITRDRYTLIGADSGAGKTTFADCHFVLYPWLYHIFGPAYLNKGRPAKIKWFYYSLEISKIMKQVSWISVMFNIVKKHHIETRTLARFDDSEKMSSEEVKFAQEVWPFVEDLFRHMTFVDKDVTYAMMKDEIETWYEENGKFVNGKYVPNDPDVYVIVLVDSLNLVEPRKGENLKDTMDNTSKMLRTIRNKYGTAVCAIQQFNTNMMNAERNRATTGRQTTDSSIRPTREDFGDSRGPYRDADIVFGGVHPFSYAIPSYFGYPIFNPNGNDVYLGKGFTVWNMMKNRWGPSDAMFPVFRNTPAPLLFELPKITNETPQDWWRTYAGERAERKLIQMIDY